MKKNRKGFTLIELLIVIAIIGILAGVILVSTSSARNKATAASTKQTLASLKQAMAVCCTAPNATLNAATDAQATAGRDICDNDGAGAGTTGIGTNFPDKTALKAATSVTYAVTNDCTANDPEISVTLAGHPMGACNNAWSLKLYGGITAPAGC